MPIFVLNRCNLNCPPTASVAVPTEAFTSADCIEASTASSTNIDSIKKVVDVGAAQQNAAENERPPCSPPEDC